MLTISAQSFCFKTLPNVAFTHQNSSHTKTEHHPPHQFHLECHNLNIRQLSLTADELSVFHRFLVTKGCGLVTLLMPNAEPATFLFWTMYCQQFGQWMMTSGWCNIQGVS